ncbi:hypothetical protein EDD18DRAFT_1111108 [Armillaria luteobubalina]|uniref:DUF6589 domain-containing protein n=1 Tax=Armillaria luteobubalina TaxID=153913 RepID=A0AA39PMR8_9AGAR|nr:hypothetical protein EDD18DRAFT_1111108 [Armillaria luteobubalina]
MSDRIDIHKTDLYPQPAWDIDESTITGNTDFVDTAYTELDIIDKPGWLVQSKFANANLVGNLRWQCHQADVDVAPPPSDEIFENACLFLHDALLTRELTDSIKADDSGRVMLVLKVMAFSFHGNGTYELLDKARMMHDSLGTNIGTQHAPSDLSLDITSIMKSLADHEVYEIKGRHFAEEDGAPVPDVVAVGFQQLNQGTKNPLHEYNIAFTHLQAQRGLQPIVGEGEHPPIKTTRSELDKMVDVDMDASHNEDVYMVEPTTVSFGTTEDLSDFEHAILDNEPTLTLETAADVSLDMDLGDDRFVFDDDEDEADEDEEPEEPSAEVD